jgi:hypothetical protein
VNGDWSPFDAHTVRMMIRYDCSGRMNACWTNEIVGCLILIALDQSTLMNSGTSPFPSYPHFPSSFPLQTNPNSGLWGFLSAWRSLFDRFDADHSGSISFAEFNEALVAFGYRLSQGFVTLLYQTYDRSGRNALSFDLFVQACISLKRMTDVFKKYDEDRDGYITLSL